MTVNPSIRLMALGAALADAYETCCETHPDTETDPDSDAPCCDAPCCDATARALTAYRRAARAERAGMSADDVRHETGRDGRTGPDLCPEERDAGR